MLYVKPYGRSVTLVNEKHRKIRVNNRSKNPNPDIREFEDFNTKDPRILIAQWISIIDKIIRKPNQKDQDFNSKKAKARRKAPSQNDELRKEQIQLRTRLGERCWDIIKLEIPVESQEEYHKIWLWKLHPWGSDYAKFQNDREYHDRKKRRRVQDPNYRLDFRGRWFRALTGLEQPNQINMDDLVDSIWLHLNKAELRIDGRKRSRKTRQHDGTYRDNPKGLMAGRAISIASNSLQGRMQKMLVDGQLAERSTTAIRPGWNQEDEAQLSTVGDLANLIFQKNRELERNHKRVNEAEAAAIIFEHYGKQFGSTVPRLEIQKTQPGLLALYDAIRSYYKRFLKNSLKGRKVDMQPRNSALSGVLPRSDSELCALLGKRHTNSVVGDLIRLGRVLHYESSQGDDDSFGLKKNDAIWQRPMSEIAASRYWTSDGQAEVKRAEAFVRVWRHVLSLASRTAKAMVDPNNELPEHQGRPADILDRKVSQSVVNDPARVKHAVDHLPLLLGSKATLFTESPATSQAIVYATLRLLANFRNKGFHFKGRKTFVRSLKNGFSNPGDIIGMQQDDTSWKLIVDAMEKLLADDTSQRHQRLLSELEGAQVQTFADTDELTAFVDLVASTRQADFVLPKFNRLLLRLANKNVSRVTGTSGIFPEPASEVELKDPARLAKYVGFKCLYSGPFRGWIENLPFVKLSEYVERAIAAGTDEARKINRSTEFQELIKAKPDALPRPVEGQSIADYMDVLQAEQASEMRIQKGYESNPEAARKQAGWLENFRCDIIGHAFADHLKSHKTDLEWLMVIKPGAVGNQKGDFPETTREKPEQEETWLACIYYLLHLVPVDDVSRLLHQFRKWSVLEQKAGHTKSDIDIEALKRVLSLYLDMHDAKHDGSGVELAGLAPFEELFENPDDFETVFVTDGSTRDRLSATRRGLREIMRFGHLGGLNSAIRMKPITRIEISELMALERIPADGNQQDSEIAKAQLRRKELHRTITTSRKGREEEWPQFNDRMEPLTEEYSKLLALICRHRILANRVRLNNQIRLHRLMMRVVSRLIDYAGTWERDGYFISLALMKLHNWDLERDILADSGPGNKHARDFRKEGKLPREETMLTGGFREMLGRFYTLGERQIRNDLAHFNILAGNNVDLTAAVNQVRRLMAYDRKLKNAISGSIIDLLFEEGLTLNWTMDSSHQLGGAKVNSRKIMHLENHLPKSDSRGKRQTDDRRKKFMEPFHDAAFVSMVEHLFLSNEVRNLNETRT